MTDDLAADYLAGLSARDREVLARVNRAGLAALREYLSSGAAVAFLGAGVSASLYPLWDSLIGELVDAASGRLTDMEAATLRAMAGRSPEEVVEIIRQQLGVAGYREVLRQVLRARVDPVSGRSWTPVQELVCRCAFKAVVTTNYDPGIVNARMRVRPRASATGFTTWEDELGLDEWRSGDVFGGDELPVLFAHGQHNRPDSVVLAATEYRQAYAGRLPRVLDRLLDGHVAWIGFSFADQRIAGILREIANHTGTRFDPGAAPRHVAVIAWDPAADAGEPEMLARRAEIGYGARLVLYPAPAGDHSALGVLLAGLTDDRFPPVGNLPVALPPGPDRPPAGNAEAVAVVPQVWLPAPEPVAYFTGRADELAQLDRWAADPQVAVIGVTAWGGAGKTALVARWVEAGGPARRPGVRGVFGWSFYADPSAERWAEALLEWARRTLGIAVGGTVRPAWAVLALLRTVPLLVVLDGLEVVQEGPAGNGFGRLLDGTLREVLAGACQQPGQSLAVLTSRFPFADLETFDGSTARMLEVPPFTPAEGAALLAAAGAGWLGDQQRRELVEAVDGHALATGVLARVLAARPPAGDLAALRADLDAAARTDARVAQVLEFYSGRLAASDGYLLAAVSLFARPVTAEAVLAVAGHEAFGARLVGQSPAMVLAAVRTRLAGLASCHPDGTISAHPLIRDTFRRLVLDAAGTAAQTALAGVPDGTVTSRADALRVVEVIELLLDAGQWKAADDMYQGRSDRGSAWRHLPAARLGQRASAAFVATPARRADCLAQLGPRALGYYLNATGLFAMNAGDLATGHEYLELGTQHDREAADSLNLSRAAGNLAECLTYLGQIDVAGALLSEVLACAQTSAERLDIRNAHAWAGRVADLNGDAREAEEQFIMADRIGITDNPDNVHLFSMDGTWWADFMARTGRPGPAAALTTRNIEIAQQYGWNEQLARCNVVAGRLALAAGDTAAAGAHLAVGAAAFRDGDYLTELARALPSLADHARVTGDLEAAERYATEAVSIAAPRSMIPAHCAALAGRARIRAAQAGTSDSQDVRWQGRDAADAALRLATRHSLAWSELDALRAHAALDRAEHADHGWAARAEALRARLVPPDLDPDPLATVERLVEADKSAEGQDDAAEGES